MKKTIFAALFAIAAAYSANAQSMYDGLLFSENEYIGSARTMAMGNAFTALGGDTGAMGLNPAGAAIIKNSVWSISAGFNTSVSSAMGTNPENADATPWYGDYNKTRSTNASVPNIGIIYSFDTHRSSGVKRVSVGMFSNMTKSYIDNTRASGNTYGTSYSGFMAANTTDRYSNLVDKNAYDNGYPWDCIAAVQSGMISTINGSDNVYVGTAEKYTTNPDGTHNIFTAGTLNQKYGRTVDGAKKDGVLDVALDINDWIYLGFNFGITQLRYSQGWHLEEQAQDRADFDIIFNDNGKEVLTYFNSLRYQYRFSAKGSGIYGKLGVIMTPTKSLRIGATIQTPTYMAMTESWNVAAATTFENTKYDSESSSPDGMQRYVLHTPWVASIGVATTISKKAIISADYEATFFNTMKFGTNGQDERFGAVNESIRDCMGIQHNIRLGGEYKVTPQIALRAGYDMHTTAVTNDYDTHGDLVRIATRFRHAASAGIGFQTKGALFFDIAAKANFYENEYIRPYGDYIYDNNGDVLEPSPEICNVRTVINGVFTVGWRF